MAAILIIEDEINVQEQRQRLRLYRRNIRDAINPFEIPDAEFIRLYRFSQDATFLLIEELMPYLFVSNHPSAIAPHFQVLTALNFFSSGSYQRKVGQDFMACVSQASVSVILHRVVSALNELMNDWITFPVTEEQIEEVQMGFWQQHRFPGVVGLIDGTHVAIVPPNSEREHNFINRKGYHSLNVLIVCDADMRIRFVNACHGGRAHDSRVFLASLLSHHLHMRYQNGHRYFWLLGDSGYPLLPYLLIPMLNQPEGSPSWYYTRCHLRVRSKVERTIGRLKGIFRCLRKDRVMHYTPDFTGQVVNACCVLHNMRITWRVPINVDPNYEDPIDVDQQEVLDDLNIEYLADGVAVRDALINNFFAQQNPEG